MNQRRRLKILLVITFVITLLLYAGYNARLFFEGPRIEVFGPENGTSSDSPLITLTGTAKNTAFININGRPLYVNENNEFREELLLPPGTSIMEIEATDRFGREARVQLWYTYMSEAIIPTATPPVTTASTTETQEIVE